MGSLGTGRNTVGRQRTINDIIDENPKLNTPLEKAFDKANLIGENADLYKVLYSYKAFREMDRNDIEIVYDYLAERLGF